MIMIIILMIMRVLPETYKSWPQDRSAGPQKVKATRSRPQVDGITCPEFVEDDLLPRGEPGEGGGGGGGQHYSEWQAAL